MKTGVEPPEIDAELAAASTSAWQKARHSIAITFRRTSADCRVIYDEVRGK